MTKPSMKDERPPAELVALAAWVNVSSPENLPKKMRARSDPSTMAAWQRVSEALIQYQNQTLAAERDALKAEVERLREALIPFSEEAGWWFEKNYNASDKVVEPFEDYYGFMTCGDLFRARAALQENTDD